MILKGSREREELRSGEAKHERDHTDLRTRITRIL